MRHELILCSSYVFPIIGGRKVEHLHDNVQALKLKLTSAQIAYLEDVKTFDAGFPSSFIGDDPRFGQKSFLHSGPAPLSFTQGEKPIAHE